jgi:hypothetical protein
MQEPTAPRESPASTICPVPPQQRPLLEYEQLCRSWFFRWPAADDGHLPRALLVSWLLIFPLALVVAGGSVSLRHDPYRLVIEAALAALSLPMLLLARQWLGWGYVRRRLRAESVEYEESGWYDGQVWEKPLLWRQQDLLVVRHQVDPVLARLRRSILFLTALMLGGAGLCQAF